MGERFISYRMKNMNEDKIVDFVMANNVPASVLDDKLSTLYDTYLGELIKKTQDIDVAQLEVDERAMQAIVDISKAGTRLRTPVMTDDREHFVSEPPVPEMPTRVLKQLANIAKSFTLMQIAETGNKELSDDMINAIQWIGYSIADDKRRHAFNAVLGLEKEAIKPTTHNISAYTGMHVTAVKRIMSVLSAIGVVRLNIKSHQSETDSWTIVDRNLKKIVERIDPPKEVDQQDYQDEEDLPAEEDDRITA
jgi:hypothetical protein